MEKNYCYRLTLTMPETGIVIENDIILNKEVSIYSIPQIAVDKGIITRDDINNITSVVKITDNQDTDKLLYQAEQIILRPKENYGTGKQFSHLMKDLKITDYEYTIMMDIGKITKDEITIVIYPNKFKNMQNMIKRTISQVIGILNLNSTKIVSVNYILSEDISKVVDNEKNATYDVCGECCECGEDKKSCCAGCDNECCEEHPDYPDDEYDYEDGDCNEECSCFSNPDLECCKSCDMTNDCGCYIKKTNRHEFSYTEDSNNNEPEKTIRIPVTPINPKDEIIMLARAIAKRLDIITEADGGARVVISLNKDIDGHIDTSLRMKTSYDMVCNL